MKYFTLSLFLGLAALFASCANEVDVNAPFEETTVIYAALDASTSLNYIRVTRAYLGQDGISGGNQVGDSLYYDSLTVQLIGRNAAGQIQSQITAEKDNSVRLDSGFFTGDGYHVYRVIGNLNEDYSYRVRVTRPDGSVVYGETQMVQDFDITNPRFPNINPGGDRGQLIEWEEAVNGRAYIVTVNFLYVEFPRNNKADSTRGLVALQLPYTIGQSLDGIFTQSTTLTRDLFYGNIDANLDPPTGNRIRIPRRVDFIITAAGDDLATHINVSQPQTGVSQDPPFFTNVVNGVGVVSSTRRSFVLNRKLANRSIDELVYGEYTCDLRFGRVESLDTLFCQP